MTGIFIQNNIFYVIDVALCKSVFGQMENIKLYVAKSLKGQINYHLNNLIFLKIEGYICIVTNRNHQTMCFKIAQMLNKVRFKRFKFSKKLHVNYFQM